MTSRRIKWAMALVFFGGSLVACVWLGSRHLTGSAPVAAQASGPEFALPTAVAFARQQPKASTGVAAPKPTARPSPTNALPDPFPGATVLHERTVPGRKADFTVRERVLETAFKHPRVLVRDEIGPSSQGGDRVYHRTELVADHVLVRLRDGMQAHDLEPVARKLHATILRKLHAPDLYLVELARHDLDAVVEAIRLFTREAAVVAYAEPNYIYHAVDRIPDDPLFADLWGMHNTGQTGGLLDADIDAPEAWSIAQGARDILVGVIDTGIDYAHVDLAANMWTNSGESGLDDQGQDRATNGKDDDNNGFVDDVRGWDFYNDDNDPMDDVFHGTHVAGTIGAAGDNGVGVAGVNWSVSLVGLKFLGAFGGTLADAVDAVRYATGLRVRLTSNSWGGGGYAQSLYDAIDDAKNNDILFVAAAGNNWSDSDEYPAYPAAMTNDNILSVAATDHEDELAYFSNYGLVSVDIGAPGVDVMSCVPDDEYAAYSGTSMATPHAAGVAALMLSLDPGLSHGALKAGILASADPIPALAGKSVSGSRLNAMNALARVGMVVRETSPASGSSTGEVPSAYVVRFSFAYDAATVGIADFRVNGQAASAYELTDSNVVTFLFNESPVVQQGPQSMAMAEGSVMSWPQGEPLHAWEGVFYYDLQQLAVTSTVPAEGGMATLPFTNLVLHFNEPVDGASIGTDDLKLGQGSVSTATLIDSQSVAYGLSGVLNEGTQSVMLAAGAVTDVHGNRCALFHGFYGLDVGEVPFAAGFRPLSPRGSLAYAATVSASIGEAGDEDAFVIAMDGNQSLGAEIVCPNGVHVAAEVRRGGLVLNASTGTPGGVTRVQAVPCAEAGSYTVMVRDAGGAAGRYVLKVFLNAVFEDERDYASMNDTPGEAQDLDPFFTSPGGAGEREVVLGSLAETGTVYYSEDFESGLGGYTFSSLVFYASLPTGLWHLTTARAADPGHTADHALYYGGGEGADGGGQYSTGSNGNGGVVYSPIIALPTNRTRLEFNTFIDLPWQDWYNVIAVAVRPTNTPYFTEIASSYPAVPFGTQRLPWWTTGGWARVSLDLGDYTGQAVQFQFTFITPRYADTDYEGWFIDDIAIRDALVRDWYRFSATEGEAVSFALARGEGPEAELELMDASGARLATASHDARNVSSVIDRFLPPASTSYYIRVAGEEGSSYRLVATRDAVFQVDGMIHPDARQELDGARGAFGALSAPAQLFAVDWPDYYKGPVTFDVLMLDPATAEVLRRIAFPYPYTYTGPYAFNAAFDGTYLWLTDGRDWVSKYDLENGETLGYWDLLPDEGAGIVLGLAWFRGELFATDYYGTFRAYDDATVQVKRRSGGSTSSSVTGLGGDPRRGVIWEVSQDHQLYKRDPQTGNGLEWHSSETTNWEQGLAVVGDEIFVSETSGDGGNNDLAVYDANTLALKRRMPAPVEHVVSGLGGDGVVAVTSSWYTFEAAAGDTLVLTTLTPGCEPEHGAAFENRLDPRLTLYDPSGDVVASDDNSAPDGKNARIEHVAATGGRYSIQVQRAGAASGEYELRVDGASAGAGRFAVRSTDPEDGACVQYLDELTLTFTHHILPASLDASDVTIGGYTASVVRLIDGKSAAFSLGFALTDGTHAVHLPAGAVTNGHGRPVDAYDGLFKVDTVPPRVVASSIVPDQALPEGVQVFTFHFSESIRADVLAPNDVTLRGVRAGEVRALSIRYDATNFAVRIEFPPLPEDAYTLSLLAQPGNFADLAGNLLAGYPSWPLPSGSTSYYGYGMAFTLPFTVDRPAPASPLTWRPRKPLGSLVYTSAASCHAGPGDKDTFLLHLEASQTVSAVVYPEADFLPRIQIAGGGTMIGTGQGSRTGTPVLVKTAAVPVSGVYTVEVSGASSSNHGWCAIGLVLNAAIECEAVGLGTNDARFRAEPIDASQLTLPAGSCRYAVCGRTDAGVCDVSPDRYGYAALAVEHQFEDISGTGKAVLKGKDSEAVEVTSAQLDGFAFAHYGRTHSNVFINCNGVLSFGAAWTTDWQIDLSYSTSPALIAPFWDDLVIEGAADSAIYWEVRGTGDDQRLIVQWHRVMFYGQTEPGDITFQVVLYEKSGRMRFNYADLETEPRSSVYGTAAVGTKSDSSPWDARSVLSVSEYYQVAGRFLGTGKSVLIGQGLGSARTPDIYSVQLSAGSRASFVAAAEGDGALQVDVLDTLGTRLQQGIRRSENVASLAQHFVAPATATYYLSVTGDGGVDYTLLAVVGAAFEDEPNDGWPGGIEARLTGRVLGGLGATDADYFSFRVPPEGALGVRTYTPGDAAGDPSNGLDPALDLFHPSSALVASDENGAGDGRNARLSRNVVHGGSYSVRVRRGAGAGEFFAVAEQLPDQPPVLVPLPDVDATIGRRLEFPVRAQDRENDAITLAASGLPEGAAFEAVGGSGVFRFTPRLAQSGAVYRVSFVAADKDGSDTQHVYIRVTGALVSPNLLVSPGFEEYDDPSWILKWKAWEEYEATANSYWTHRSGSSAAYCANYLGSAEPGRLYQDVFVAPGTYTFSLWMRRTPYYTATVSQISIEWLDADGNTVKDADVQDLRKVPGDEKWHPVHVTGTCTNPLLARVRVGLTSSGSHPASRTDRLDLFDDAALYTGERQYQEELANPGFEEGETSYSWYDQTQDVAGTQWDMTPPGSGFSKVYDKTSHRSGTFGAQVFGRQQTASSGAALLSQGLTPKPGAFVYSIWIRRNPNNLMTNAELRLDWFDRSLTNRIQTSSVQRISLPADGMFYRYAVTGACHRSLLYELRVGLFISGPQNLATNYNTSIFMDDAWLERIAWGGDSDGDGLNDGWEVAHFGGSDLADADADSDGDGASEYAEFRAGTDPHDGSSVLALRDVDEPESGLVIRWPSASGITYAIDRAIDLAEGFSPYRTGIAATPPENVFRDTNAAAAVLYYRIRVE